MMSKKSQSVRGLVLAVVLATVFSSAANVCSAAALWNVGGNEYQYRQEITVSSALTATNLTDFPLLVQITNPVNPVFANAVNGSDIIFTAADGATQLAREIENFTTGGTPSLNAWVRTDVSASSDTTIYMYYNGPSSANSTAVWDGNYQLVQHLQESSAGPFLDSTSLANNGTGAGGPVSAAGKIGQALDFNGSAVVNLGNDGSLFPTDLTLEAWVKPDAIDQWNGVFTNKRPGSPPTGVNLQTGTAQQLSSLVGDGSTYTYVGAASTLDPVVDTWYHLTLVHDDTDKNRFYVNGVQVGGVELRGLGYGAGTLPTVQIGAFYSGSLLFKGIIDEVRLSDTARSADWIHAGFLLGDNASAFLTFGAEATAIPEPSSFVLLGLGLLGLRRQRGARAQLSATC